MLGEKFDVVRLQAIVISKRPEKLSAGQLVRKLVATVGRGHLFENVVAPERNIEPADARQHRCRQEIFLEFAAFQLFAGYADTFTETEKQCSMTKHGPR